ncbi:nucleotidyltransferase domain-containing protein [Prosthecochloris sp. GSB1]|uniref:nucleotidyltransferase domain-containing protein n=1 Tax=Prosthecochloris sp. GSB1 TaxID=281093 RepID=UPI00142D3AD2|nr:nucleotidyltransferase family protein [Prosthecochloris sp. GSB1]
MPDESAVRKAMLGILRADEAMVKASVEGLLPEEWQEFCVEGEAHGIVPLAHAVLRSSGISVPGFVEKKLRAAYLRTAEQNSIHYHYADRVFAACAKAGIEVIPLKGIDLARRVYETIALREMSDIDILVRRGDLGRMDSILVDHGFRPLQAFGGPLLEEGHHLRYRHADAGAIIEVHWNLMDPADRIVVDIDALWERAGTVDGSAGRRRELSFEDLLLYLAVHLANHTFSLGLRGLYDMAAVIHVFGDTIDWSRLLKTAFRWNATRALQVNLRLLEELLHVPLPGGVFEKFGDAGFEESYYEVCRELVFASYEPNNPVFSLRFQREGGKKAGFILESLLPAPRAIALKYPDARHALDILLRYPLYYGERIKKYSGALWRLARRDREALAAVDRQESVLKVKRWLLSG